MYCISRFMTGGGERLGGEPSAPRAVILFFQPRHSGAIVCAGFVFCPYRFMVSFCEVAPAGGADNGYVGAFGPAGGVDCGGVALAVLRQHPAAVEVVDLQAEECEGGEDLNPVAGGVGVGVLFILSARISVRRWC